MKKLFLFIMLLQSIAATSQVVIALRGQYQGNPVNLDSIIIENLSQPGKMMLAAPPGITTYFIDLLSGSFNGIHSLTPGGERVRVLSMMPGQSRLAVFLARKEIVRGTIYAMNGSVVHRWNSDCSPGQNMVDLTVAGEGVFVCRLSGEDFSFTCKVAGNRDVVTNCTTVPVNTSTFKLSPAFIFNPGNEVRFTAVKAGLHRNFASLKPINHDTIRVILSAPCPGSPTVTDYDGNVYNTVQIGNQCWIKENMRAKHYSDGTALVDGTGVGNISGDVVTPYWFAYADNPANAGIYGLLYTAEGATGYANAGVTQGICPDGWHVSTSGDWCLMDKFLDLTYYDCSYPNQWPGPLGFWGGTQIRNKLLEPGIGHWTCGDPQSLITNESGFTALSGGGRGLSGGYFYEIGISAVWWATGPGSGITQMGARGIRCDSVGDYRGIFPGESGNSVRCVKN